MDEKPQDATEAAPQHGTIVHRRYPLELCDIDCWREGDEFVVRASDFELYAVGATQRDAVSKFIDEVYSLADALQHLGDDARIEEKALFVRLATPIVEAYREDQRREQHRLIAFPRFRGDHSPAHEWSPASGRARSGLPSIA